MQYNTGTFETWDRSQAFRLWQAFLNGEGVIRITMLNGFVYKYSSYAPS